MIFNTILDQNDTRLPKILQLENVANVRKWSKYNKGNLYFIYKINSNHNIIFLNRVKKKVLTSNRGIQFGRRKKKINKKIKLNLKTLLEK